MKQADEAVSTVLGAVLVFGLLVVTLVTIQVKFVPVWDREKEADHMDLLAGQIAALKSDVDRQADNRTSVPVTDPLTLGVGGGFRFFTSAHLNAAVSFAPPPAAGGFTVSSAHAVHVLAQNGQQIFAGTEAWQNIVGNTASNVVTVQNFRVRVQNPASYATGQSVTVTLTDAAGAYAGGWQLYNIDHGPTYTFEYRTFAASSSTTPITVVQENFDKQNPPAYMYVDVLRRDLQLNQVLATANPPFRIDIGHNGIVADFTLAYKAQPPGGGVTQVGLTGRVVPSFSTLLAGGSLSVTANNQRFPRQTYTVEHGGVIVQQPDGAVMQVPPEFSTSLVAGQTTVGLVVPALVGLPASVTGPPRAGVTLSPAGGLVDMQVTAPDLTLQLATLQPAVWTRYWTQAMQGAGLSVGTCVLGNPAGLQSCTATDAVAGTATLTIYGIQPAANSTVDDIVLNLKGGRTQVTLQSGASG